MVFWVSVEGLERVVVVVEKKEGAETADGVVLCRLSIVSSLGGRASVSLLRLVSGHTVSLGQEAERAGWQGT